MLFSLKFKYSLLGLDPCTSLEAELWGIFHGISLALEKGYNNLIIETDSAEAYDLLVGVNGTRHSIALGILQLFEEDTVITWSKIDRTINGVADTLAKQSHSTQDAFTVYDFLPYFYFKPSI